MPLEKGTYAPVAQWIEQTPSKRKVAGSNPVRGTSFTQSKGCNKMATLSIDVVEATGVKKSSTVPAKDFDEAAHFVAKTMEALCTLEDMGIPQHLDDNYHLRLMAWTFGDGSKPITLERTDGSQDTWTFLA